MGSKVVVTAGGAVEQVVRVVAKVVAKVVVLAVWVVAKAGKAVVVMAVVG